MIYLLMTLISLVVLTYIGVAISMIKRRERTWFALATLMYALLFCALITAAIISA